MSGGVQVAHLVCTAWDGASQIAYERAPSERRRRRQPPRNGLVAGNNKRIPADAWAVPSLSSRSCIVDRTARSAFAADQWLTDEQRGTLMMNTSPEDRPRLSASAF
jgi:hypothetical protein